ncbi:MAG: TIGR02677 family protein [Clostridiales bacterium]|nr:TIGR02677 family protein [Clostridiales bacterium]
MHITDKLVKPITETAYLTAENVKRYRMILRYFYMQHERIKYWLDQDEIFQALQKYEEFSDYTMEQCRQDLNALVNWKNLIPVQDTKKVNSVEAFKNRQFRYQLTEYTVEIERMTIRLENLFIEGTSLEPTLLERIKNEMQKIKTIGGDTLMHVHTWWEDLNNDFKRLNQNYQDYMRSLNSAKAEELMKSAEFLIYKDNLIEYLRSFIKGLQLNVGTIERLIVDTADETLEAIFQKVTDYEMTIPRMDVEVNEKSIYENIKGRWKSIKDWFAGDSTRESEANRLFDMTNENIRKITRYATRISEQFTMGANRKEEYKKIAEIFLKCTDIKEAHKLASMVFGVEKPLHLKGELVRETDSINSGVYEEKGIELSIKPKVRAYGEKVPRSHIRDYSVEKEKAAKEAIEKSEKEKKMIEGYMVDGKISFETLPVIEPEVRNILLRWLSKALEHKDGKGKTEEGHVYQIVNREEKKYCVLNCQDGVFEMPAFVLWFE